MIECSCRGWFPFLNRRGQRSTAALAGWLAFMIVALVMALPAHATALSPTPDPTPTPPPPCPDGDGDGYVQCDGVCDSTGKLCGDPDDGDARIHPGAPCGLCNGPGCGAAGFSGYCVPGSSHRPCADSAIGVNRNETTSFCMNINSPLIGTCSNDSSHKCFVNADCGGGTCNSAVAATGSGLTANADGSGAACASTAHPVVWGAEGGSTLGVDDRRAAASCSDNTDNDCDGFVDTKDQDCQTPEVCDNKDNDGNGIVDDVLHIGESCTDGVGACQSTGTKVCAALDGTATLTCNAVPKSPGVEGPFGSPSCGDGIDNDCDGQTDFPADSSCRSAEVCDGLDNDGDGAVDNGFDVGAPCSAGIGACQANGVKVCAADGKGTVCNAVAKVASLEGPGAPGSCSDGIDNDCDGLADSADPSCGNVALHVSCALPFRFPSPGGRGSPGKDCNSSQKIVFDEPAGAKVTAELVAIDTKGTVIASMPVKNGEFAHLASRLSPDDYRFETDTTSNGVVTHTVFAPMPMLRVTATDGINKARAYCTTDPYLDLVSPAGGVVAVNKSAQGSQADSTPVLVAIPEVSPGSLVLKVDGVSIFPALGKTGAQCSLATPCSGNVTINGASVAVSDLIVDVAASLDAKASNTLTMKLGGMGCGGHVVSVSGKKIPGSIPDNVTSQCLVDDLADKGVSYTFTLEITKPVNQSAGNPVPTDVEGKACHGLPISSVQINGKEVFDASLMTVTPNPPPPPGADTAAKFEFPIVTSLEQTSLARDIVFGDAPAGTFDEGSNFVQGAATDSMGNRVFNNSVVFATGNTAKPGVGPITAPTGLSGALDPQLQAAFEGEVAAQVKEAFKEVALGMGLGLNGPGTIEVPNAFVVELNGAALTNFFNTKCSQPGADGLTLKDRFQRLANQKVVGKTFGTFHAPSPCSCDPPFNLTVTSLDFTNQLMCPVFFPGQHDSYDGSVVPDDAMRVVIQLPDITAHMSGGGWCEEDFLGVCIDDASINISLSASVNNIRLRFDITEAQLKGTAPPSDPQFNAGVSATIEDSIHVDTHVGCIGGVLCQAVVTVFTLGFIDVSPTIDINQSFDLSHEIGQAEPDPIKLHDIKLDEEKIANFNQRVKGSLVDVNISSEGLRASLTGKFSTDIVDPAVVANPGQFLEMPPTPELPLPVGVPQDGAVLVNADSINMMFASLTLSGHLKSECSTSNDPNTGQPRTLGSLLPADCNSISPANDAAAALARGLCFGFRTANCEGLKGPGFFTTPVEQGTCHGMEGDNCDSIATGMSGIVMPDDCNTITIGGGDSTDPSRATDIARGRCFAIKGTNCETLSAGTDVDTAIMQGACHGQKADVCTGIAVSVNPNQEIGTCGAVENIACGTLTFAQTFQCNLSKVENNIIEALLRVAEQQSCNIVPAVNVNANQQILFCAKQDLPPHFVVHDDPGTQPVEVGLRMNDLSLGVVIDRNNNGILDGDFNSLPPCIGNGVVATGDCGLAALCLDLNFEASFELAGNDCPAEGGKTKPGFKARITHVEDVHHHLGQVCGGMPAGGDTDIVDGSSTDNASISAIGNNAQAFSPPACMSGLTLGGFVSFDNPTIFALRTGSPKSVCANDSTTVCTSNAQCGGGSCVPIQNFIGISTNINPNP